MTIETHGSSDLPEHKSRRADVDPRAAKRAERQVGFLFIASGLASAAFIVAYAVTPVDKEIRFPGVRQHERI